MKMRMIIVKQGSEAMYFQTMMLTGRSQEYSVVSDSVGPCGLHSPLGSSVHGIFQARIPEWVAISSSRGSSQPRDRIFVFYV